MFEVNSTVLFLDYWISLSVILDNFCDRVRVEENTENKHLNLIKITLKKYCNKIQIF